MSSPASAEPDPSAPETHFGFTNVRLDEKQGLVNDVFHKVASRYDLMNDLMSAGLHRAWKDVLVGMAKPFRTRTYRHLDVAGGTGDVAFRIAEAGGATTEVTVLDINPNMLAVGRDRAEARGLGHLDFVEANAEELPFAANTFDGYTIAFGIRNVPRLGEMALGEARREIHVRQVTGEAPLDPAPQDLHRNIMFVAVDVAHPAAMHLGNRRCSHRFAKGHE